MTYSLSNAISSNTLEEFHMIAGDEQNFVYNAYGEDGEEINLSGATCSILIFKYGDPANITVTLNGIITASPVINQFTSTLPSGSSVNMSGVYQQQVKIVDYLGKEHRPAQGKIVVFPTHS